MEASHEMTNEQLKAEPLYKELVGDLLELTDEYNNNIEATKTGTEATKDFASELLKAGADLDKSQGVWNGMGSVMTEGFKQSLTELSWDDIKKGKFGALEDALKQGVVEMFQRSAKTSLDRMFKPMEEGIDNFFLGRDKFGGSGIDAFSTTEGANKLLAGRVASGDEKAVGTEGGITGAITGAMGGIGDMLTSAWQSISGVFTGLFTTQSATDSTTAAANTATKIASDASLSAAEVTSAAANTATKVATDTTTAATQTAGTAAQTVTITGVLSAILASTTSLLGTLVAVNTSGFASVATASMFSSGGIVPELGQKPQYFASGGLAKGTDTVPAMLTPGEMVLNKSQQEGLGANTYNTYNLEISGNVDQRAIDQIRGIIQTSPKQVNAANTIGQRNQSGIRRR